MKNILLIESDEISRLLMKELMFSENIHFTECKKGSEALLVLKQINFSAILLNTRLTDYDGWELLKMIKIVEPKVPVIGISAETPNDHYFKKSKVKFDQYFGLPLDLSKFFNEIRILVDRN